MSEVSAMKNPEVDLRAIASDRDADVLQEAATDAPIAGWVEEYAASGVDGKEPDPG
jgi:hypothetical protein